ncbi:MAG TPA: acyl-CoA dehydrogenase family protein [Iamia sp.]|nr:acyl-CoA dehydrogenase family protein [Iamia sp.]
MTAREDTPAEAKVRAEVRPWMEEHAARFGPTSGRRGLRDDRDHVAACQAWQAELDADGWGAVTWPVEHGGRGYGPVEARIVGEEANRYEVPVGALNVAIGMVGPTLMAHGTPQQQAHIASIRRGEEVWCQLFSEPDAGSDLASLRTTAVRDGDGWVVEGQKVWTSGARHADWGILLARTEPGSVRHRGITYFLIDMRSPGVEVRPLVQINRAAHFNEVFLREVRLPGDAVLGEVGDGWSVARTTLGAERVMIGSISVLDRVEDMIEVARANGRSTDPVVRQALADAYVHASVLGLTGDRVVDAIRLGAPVGPEASTLKLGLSLMMERLAVVATHVAGPEMLLEGSDDGTYGPLQNAVLAQWSARIGGGTEQIQRNVIGERALGLPREPR